MILGLVGAAGAAAVAALAAGGDDSAATSAPSPAPTPSPPPAPDPAETNRAVLIEFYNSTAARDGTTTGTGTATPHLIPGSACPRTLTAA